MDIIPSIFTHTEEQFFLQINAIKDIAPMVHIDIADGVFVPNTTWADPHIIKKSLPMDCELHLMAADPLAILKQWANVHQVKRVITHIEAVHDENLIKKIHGLCKKNTWQFGLSINPETSVSSLLSFVFNLDAILFMAVHPGRQGQAFIPETLDKVKQFHKMYPKVYIELDGGVNAETLPAIAASGVDAVTPGSAVFGVDDPKKNFIHLKSAIKKINLETMDILDLVIIGGAAVGSAAAVYASRRNLDFVVVTKDLGGEVALSGDVDNWPGIVHTTGVELAKQFQKHVESYKAPIDIGFDVVSIAQEKNYHVVTAQNDTGEKKIYKTKTVIVGSGIHPRALNVPGESKLKGMGVTSCTVCDGPLFKGKTTVTIGAGNSALESALMMAGIAKKVYVITKYPDTKEAKGGFPPGENILIDKLKELPNVEIIYEANTLEILGGTSVTGVRYEDLKTKQKKDLEVQGVMVHIGVIPNSDFITCVTKNKLKEIEVDTLCRTSVPGIFAGGDVTNVPFKQIAIAAGHGVTAALSAIDYINRWK